MLIGTICQIFVVPALFAVFQWLQEKLTPLKFEDELNEEVAAELEQYANAAHQQEGYREEVITQCNFKGNNEKEFKYHHIGSRSALLEQLQGLSTESMSVRM